MQEGNLPKEGQEVEGSCDANVLDSFFGQVLQPSPGLVVPGKAVAEHEVVDDVAHLVEEGPAGIHLLMALGLQVLEVDTE